MRISIVHRFEEEIVVLQEDLGIIPQTMTDAAHPCIEMDHEIDVSVHVVEVQKVDVAVPKDVLGVLLGAWVHREDVWDHLEDDSAHLQGVARHPDVGHHRDAWVHLEGGSDRLLDVAHLQDVVLHHDEWDPQEHISMIILRNKYKINFYTSKLYLYKKHFW